MKIRFKRKKRLRNSSGNPDKDPDPEVITIDMLRAMNRTCSHHRRNANSNLGEEEREERSDDC